MNVPFSSLFYSPIYGLNGLVDDFFTAMWNDPGLTNLKGLHATLKSSFSKNVIQMIGDRKIESIEKKDQEEMLKQALLAVSTEHLSEIKKAMKDYYIQSGLRSRIENFAGLDLKQGRLAADVIESLMSNFKLETNINIADVSNFISYGHDLDHLYGRFFFPTRVDDSILDQFNSGVLNSKIP